MTPPTPPDQPAEPKVTEEDRELASQLAHASIQPGYEGGCCGLVAEDIVDDIARHREKAVAEATKELLADCIRNHDDAWKYCAERDAAQKQVADLRAMVVRLVTVNNWRHSTNEVRAAHREAVLLLERIKP